MTPAHVEPPPLPVGKPWGFWATLGLSAVIGGSFVLSAGLSLFAAKSVFQVLGNRLTDFSLAETPIVMEALSIGSLSIGVTVGLTLLYLFVRMRRTLAVSEYLALNPVNLRKIWLWLVAILFTMGVSTLLRPYLNVPFGPVESVIGRYVPPLIAARDVLVAVFSQTLLWGFAYKGLASSRLGVPGTVSVLSFGVALLMALPLQFSPLALGLAVFAMLLYAAARIQTNSTYTPIAMVVFGNTIVGIYQTIIALPMR